VSLALSVMSPVTLSGRAKKGKVCWLSLLPSTLTSRDNDLTMFGQLICHF
jgi:hypothetical protein